MSWKGDEDGQRLWNLVIYKVYMTDDELEEASPIMAGVVLGIIVVIGLFWLFS